tara:strand:- start:2990 stop:3226 length:237 start_codon:yes stop_codon:yes gene_type:complete
MTDIKKELLHGLTETFKEADESEKDYLNEKVIEKLWNAVLEETTIVSEEMLKDAYLDKHNNLTKKIKNIIEEFGGTKI